MEIKYPNWLPKIFGSPQTSDEMNGIVEVLQNHAETLSLHDIRILAASSGIYTDALTPTSEIPTEVGDKVFLVTIPGTYTNFGNVVLPENNFGFIFKNENNFSIQSVEMPMQTGTDTLNPLGLEIPKEIAVAKYVSSNTVNPESIGVSSFAEGDNIFKNDDYSDLLKWLPNTVVLPDGKTASANGWKTTKRTIKKGLHRTNLYLTESVFLHTLDANGNIVQSFSNKGVYVGTTEWNFTTTENEVEIIFCARNGQLDHGYSGVLYITTPIAYNEVTDSVFIKSKGLDELLKELNLKNSGFFIKPNRSGFDYRAIKNIELLNSNKTKLKDSEGKWLRLFISFMRFVEKDSVTSTILQVAKYNKETNSTDVNNISVSTFIGSTNESIIDENGYVNVELKEVDNSGINMRVLIDTNYLRVGIDTNVSLSDTIELDTSYLFAKSINKIDNTSKIGAYLGDSTVEFGTIPTQVGSILGYDVKNCGVGGTRMGVHTLADYKDLSFYKIAEAINSGDWTSVTTALNNLITSATGTDNAKAARLTTTKNNLLNTDWNKVDFICVQFGTNDFAGFGKTSGSNDIGLIDKSNLDTSTLIGALNYGVRQILMKYPKIRFYFITPTHRYMESLLTNDSDDYTNMFNKKLINYVDAIIDGANQNHFPAKDMYRESGLSKYNHSTYFADGVHPNKAGYKLFSEQVSAFIKSKMLSI